MIILRGRIESGAPTYCGTCTSEETCDKTFEPDADWTISKNGGSKSYSSWCTADGYGLNLNRIRYYSPNNDKFKVEVSTDEDFPWYYTKYSNGEMPGHITDTCYSYTGNVELKSSIVHVKIYCKEEDRDCRVKIKLDISCSSRELDPTKYPTAPTMNPTEYPTKYPTQPTPVPTQPTPAHDMYELVGTKRRCAETGFTTIYDANDAHECKLLCDDFDLCGEIYYRPDEKNCVVVVGICTQDRAGMFQRWRKINPDAPTKMPTRSPTMLPTSFPTRIPTDRPTVAPTRAQAPGKYKKTSGKVCKVGAEAILTLDDGSLQSCQEICDQKAHCEVVLYSSARTPKCKLYRYGGCFPFRNGNYGLYKRIARDEAKTAYPTTSSPINEPTTKTPTEAEAKPTSVPTAVPTISPTSAPTETPTKFPTRVPTPNPTSKPTKRPTEFPTRLLSTKKPSRSPTSFPTNTPTDRPTVAPTRAQAPGKYKKTAGKVCKVGAEVMLTLDAGSLQSCQEICDQTAQCEVVLYSSARTPKCKLYRYGGCFPFRNGNYGLYKRVARDEAKTAYPTTSSPISEPTERPTKRPTFGKTRKPTRNPTSEMLTRVFAIVEGSFQITLEDSSIFPINDVLASMKGVMEATFEEEARVRGIRVESITAELSVQKGSRRALQERLIVKFVIRVKVETSTDTLPSELRTLQQWALESDSAVIKESTKSAAQFASKQIQTNFQVSDEYARAPDDPTEGRNADKNSGGGGGAIIGIVAGIFVIGAGGFAVYKFKARDNSKGGAKTSDESIPRGWTVHLDSSTGRNYYYNTATKEVTWKKPQSSVTSISEVQMITKADAQRSTYAVAKVEV